MQKLKITQNGIGRCILRIKLKDKIRIQIIKSKLKNNRDFVQEAKKEKWNGRGMWREKTKIDGLIK